ncbi:MAG: DEAD/DEAH box helicase [Proteobacteria bacterium]|nr:DEAD/DEAH box helicase [Pseudomonadota bacterium]
MLGAAFDPAVARWFGASFAAATACQTRAWAALATGRHTLVAAPTGSGKTLAAFLTALSELATRARAGCLAQETAVLYVSPLKALGNDIQRNLERPLAGIKALLAEELGEAPSITTAVRTGDTPAAARTLMRKRPPHILVTTPESLYILLTSDSGRDMLRSVRTVIIDEIHALVGNKRGAHLALSLARLEALTVVPPVRIGLSATQRPIARVAEFLTGQPHVVHADAEPVCAIVDEGHKRARDLAIEMPPSPLETVISAEVAGELRARMVELVNQHRSTLVFVNTRRMAERLARALADELGDDKVCAHHGSMSRERRLDAETRLKHGHLKVLVATASLELGIDIGDIDLVCQLGTTRSLAMFLQRAGRAGHAVDGVARARLFPQTRDELVESIALLDMVARAELDSIEVPPGPRDVLAQQVVAEVAMGERDVAALYAMYRATWPYRELSREEFDTVLRMLADGFSFGHGRRSAYLHLDDVNGRVSARRGAKLTAVTCGGAIPDNADYDVIAEPQGERVGTVNEDFAIESLPGNIFQLGNTSWRVLRVEAAGLRVEDARGEPPNMPFWLGEAPARSAELSQAVARLRDRAARLLDADGDVTALARQLADIGGVGAVAARQAADYLLLGYRALGAMPTQDTLVMERFFDESGGMQLVIHSPFGSRLNKAWGLALRKRFCRTFNFELQAAAVEDAIVLSLGAVHSFALDDVWRYLNADSVRDVLIQAVLTAPMFTVRWRWVAGCALAIERFRGGRKTPPRLLRMNADDLAALVFPDQLACAENLGGRREVPDHPLVNQALDDCLFDAMDIVALENLLRDIAAGRKRLVARDVTEPSPFALQVLNANPYAFLDDAPLEERRTQAVSSRRWLDSAAAKDLAALDPAAIARVRDEVWPSARNAEELHDALLMLGLASEAELRRLVDDAGGERTWLDDALRALYERGRAVRWQGRVDGWCATERRHELLALEPDARLDMHAIAAAYERVAIPERSEAVTALVRARLEIVGPTSAAALAASLPCETREVEQALLALEQAGIALRGHFSAEFEASTQWCERRLLARIHRYTLNRLRQDIEAVPAAAYSRFLLDWQCVTPAARVEGSAGLHAVLNQLSGFEAPVAAWESEILPARVRGYDSRMLDEAIRAGRYVWLRLSPKRSSAPRLAGTLRTTPVSLVARSQLQAWLAVAGPEDGCQISSAARQVLSHIEQRGAAFFDDIAGVRGLLRSQVENALDELAAVGLVTCDSFVGLRALTTPVARRNPLGRRARRTTLPGIEDAGRWDRLVRPAVDSKLGDEGLNEEVVETIARVLLRRYGVVFRRIVEREAALPPWRLLLRVLRRLESAGEIRGGRFVAGATGEQFALPDAVTALRECARRDDAGVVRVAAVDPLNLVGTVLPGTRIPALANQHLALVGGEAVAVKRGTDIEFLKTLDTATMLRVRTAMLGGLESRAGGLRSRRRPL